MTSAHSSRSECPLPAGLLIVERLVEAATGHSLWTLVPLKPSPSEMYHWVPLKRSGRYPASRAIQRRVTIGPSATPATAASGIIGNAREWRGLGGSGHRKRSRVALGNDPRVSSDLNIEDVGRLDIAGRERSRCPLKLVAGCHDPAYRYFAGAGLQIKPRRNIPCFLVGCRHPTRSGDRLDADNFMAHGDDHASVRARLQSGPCRYMCDDRYWGGC